MKVTFDLPNATTAAALDTLVIEAARLQGVLVELNGQPVRYRMASKEIQARQQPSACKTAWLARREANT